MAAQRPDHGRDTLTTGDPAQAKELLGSLQAGFSHDNWRATMETDPIKSALFTMFNSNDPARLDAAGQALPNGHAAPPMMIETPAMITPS
jgi:hypothetical protein